MELMAGTLEELTKILAKVRLAKTGSVLCFQAEPSVRAVSVQAGLVDLALETLEEIHAHDQQIDAKDLHSGIVINGQATVQATRIFGVLLQGCCARAAQGDGGEFQKQARQVVDAMQSRGVWDSAKAAFSHTTDEDVIQLLTPILEE